MKKKMIFNITASMTLDVVSLICAFILPRLIITNFGSEYNGIVHSVSQFLSIVVLLRGGVGGVTRAALYKPLNENDFDKISGILKATESFMQKISYIFLVFLLFFAVLYSFFIKGNFDLFFSFSLILILGTSTFAQYYFGITYQFLLQADQRQYVYYIIQTLATILNTVLSAVLINIGIEFRLMKLVSSLVFALIPIALNLYVHKKYTLLKDVNPDASCLEQRWDAFMHQVAAFVHNNTDLIVLTLFTDLFQVSIYSVYYMVVNGVKKFLNAFTIGVEAIFGRLVANEDITVLKSSIEIYEFFINVTSTILFSCVAILIAPFMNVYMMGVEDANYIQPLFGVLLSLAFFFSSIRMPYQSVVEAAGHFKSTRNDAIIEAVLNLSISLALVIKLGCIGVAIGTNIAMCFRTFCYAAYASKNIIKRNIFVFYKRLFIDAINFLIIALFCNRFKIYDLLMNRIYDYYSWFVEAILVFLVVSIFTLALNVLIYPSVSRKLINIIVKHREANNRL